MPRRLFHAVDAFAAVSGIVFDVGDTLFDTTALMRLSLRHTALIMAKRRLIPDPAVFYENYLKIDAQVEGPSINHLFSGLEVIEKVWKALGMEFSPRTAGTFLGLHRDRVRRGLRKNARLIGIMRSLRKRGYRLAVLTDGSTEEQFEQLFRLGIVDLLDTVVTSQQVNAQKPSRQMFDFLLTSLGVEPHQAVMVGNDPERDIAGAKAIGMPAILTYGYHVPDSGKRTAAPDATIKRLVELGLLFRGPRG